jgi:hypothetical protein
VNRCITWRLRWASPLSLRLPLGYAQGRMLRTGLAGAVVALAAFVPLTPGTIVGLERVLRSYSAWEE